MAAGVDCIVAEIQKCRREIEAAGEMPAPGGIELMGHPNEGSLRLRRVIFYNA